MIWLLVSNKVNYVDIIMHTINIIVFQYSEHTYTTFYYIHSIHTYIIYTIQFLVHKSLFNILSM